MIRIPDEILRIAQESPVVYAALSVMMQSREDLAPEDVLLRLVMVLYDQNKHLSGQLEVFLTKYPQPIQITIKPKDNE